MFAHPIEPLTERFFLVAGAPDQDRDIHPFG
jgi:hypothetical protein